jgi:hypothetical protein
MNAVAGPKSDLAPQPIKEVGDRLAREDEHGGLGLDVDDLAAGADLEDRVAALEAPQVA